MSFRTQIWHKLYGMDRNCRRAYENLEYENLSFNFPSIVKKSILIHLMYFNCRRKENLFEYKLSRAIDCEKIKKLIDESDVISFDMFDTLVYRSVSDPKDVFLILEKKLNCPGFYGIRIKAEYLLRSGGKEPTLVEIYDLLGRCIKIDKEFAIEEEIKLEIELSSVNESIKKLFDYAKRRGKIVIVTSDMYLASEDIGRILKKCGYDGVDKTFVSCEWGASKRNGAIQEVIRNEYSNRKILHIGDNCFADRKTWPSDIKTYIIDNISNKGNRYRKKYNHTLPGSIYSELINQHIYNKTYSIDNDNSLRDYYELGYKYIGFLVVGFVNYVRKVVESEKIDRVFFSSRDCKVIKDVYELLYGNENVVYFLTSRNAVLPIKAKNSFISFVEDAFFVRSIRKKMAIGEVFDSIGLERLIEALPEGFSFEDIINDGIWKNFQYKVVEKAYVYERMMLDALKSFDRYFFECLGDSKKPLIVDLGWNGSVFRNIKTYIESKKSDLRVSGALMGLADTYYGYGGVLVGDFYSYLFSPEYYSTFGCLRKEDLVKSDGLKFLEYVFSDTEPSVLGYKLDNEKVEFVYDEMPNVDRNDKLMAIHKGVIDFAKEYNKRVGILSLDSYISPEVSFMPYYNLIKDDSRRLAVLFKNFRENGFMLHGNSKQRDQEST